MYSVPPTRPVGTYVIKTNGYQGKKNRWIGYNEIPDNFVNDKREYYRTSYLQSEHWKVLRTKKLRQTDFCESCNSTKMLDVHHKKYKNLYDVDLVDLEVLCRTCHIKEHQTR